MPETREQFISHSELIRKALWSSVVARPGVDVVPAHGASILVGAGMSRNAVIDTAKYGEPPDWAEISRRLVEPLAPADPAKQQKLLEQTGAVSGFLRLAQMYQARFGRAHLDRFIEENVQNDAMTPGHLHRLLLQIPWTNVFTTNWDTLLETAAKSERLRRYDIVTKAEDLPKTTGARIFKLHGTVYTTKDLIFTEEDFRTYPTRYAPFVNTVQQAMMETVFVLIGFSGEDPNFLQWTGWVRDRLGDYTPRLYLVGDHSRAELSSEMLQLNKVVPLDLGQISDAELEAAGLRPNRLDDRIEWWFRFLLAGEELPLTVWPRALYKHEQAPRESREKRFVPPEFMPDTGEDPNGGEPCTFFSTAIFREMASPALLTSLAEELRGVRREFRSWISAPPDARDDVFDGTFKQWQTNLCLGGSARKKSAHSLELSRFLQTCLTALGTEDFIGVVEKEVGRGLLNNVPRGFSKDQNVGSWIANDLADQVFDFLCEYLWLCDAILWHWPDGTLEIVLSLLQRCVKFDPEAEGEKRYFPVNSLLSDASETADLRRRLAISLLRQCRQQAVHAKTFDAAREIVWHETEAEQDPENDLREVRFIEALWYADHGAFGKVNEILLGITLRTPATPQDLHASLRHAALLDEFGATRLDLKTARELRAEAFVEIRDQAGPMLRDFELPSCESWILSLADTRIFRFLDEAANMIGVDKAELRMSIRPRLDELVAFRCDPRREIRRAVRNSDSLTYRRQAAMVLDQAGYPLATQIVRSDGRLVAKHTLATFIWKATLQELDNAERVLAAAQDRLTAVQSDKLDYAMCFALRYLFRMLSHPNQSDFYGSKAQYDINAEILPATVKIGAKLLRGAAGGPARLDAKCIRFCLDVLRYEMERLDKGTRTDESHNAVRLALIVLGALTRELRTAQSVDRKKSEVQWSKEMAYQAVDVLAALVARVDLSALQDTPDNFNEDWTFLVEDMLKLALAQALQTDGEATRVFRALWTHFQKRDGNKNSRIQPFRLIQDKPRKFSKPAIEGSFGRALKDLDDTKTPEEAAGLIRFMDATRDWGFRPEGETAGDLARKIRANYERGDERAALEPWEWLMVDEVRAKATAAFREEFFGPDEQGDLTAPERIAAARRKTENLHGALDQPRTKFNPKEHELRAALAWINTVIDASRGENRFGQLYELPKLTAIFNCVMKTKNQKKLQDEDFDLLFETLNNLLSVNAPVEMQVPELATQYADQLRASPNYFKLGSLLRRGLAMIHYPSHQDQFSRAIEATKVWIARAEQNPDDKPGTRYAPPPPPALLGALGQALARPRLNRGKRVLETIASFLDFHAGDDGSDDPATRMDLSDILVDLRHRIDGMLQGWEEDTNPELCKVTDALKEIERVVEKIASRGETSGLSGNELKRLKAGIKALRQQHPGRSETAKP